ncbi:MAG: serine hydrolase domain-containing protein [Ferruginibacter sp.]
MKYTFSFCLLMFLASVSFSQPVSEKKYAKQIKAASDSIVKMMAKKSIPGLSVAVSIKGKTVWAQAFGFSDLENRIPVTVNTKFRIGSVSKTITAVAIAQLMDEGRISLDSSVAKYVPYWPAKKYAITVGQVGSHVAGIRHYNGYEFLSAKRYENVEESMDIFKNDSLRFAPGTQYQYTSYGYSLLSAAIEGASGKSYLDFIKQRIFDPLNMNNSVPDHNDSIIPNRTRFYTIIKNKFLGNAPFVDNSNKWGSGGILSTPTDLLKFGNAILYKKILSERSRAALWTPYPLSTGKENVYGIGFRVEKNNAGQTYMSHGGTSIGGRTFFVIYPKEEVVMAITYNLLPAGYNEIELSDIFSN